MTQTPVLRFGSLACFAALLSLSACSSDPVEPATSGPIGPLASNAAEAWPDVPTVPAITHEQIARACVRAAECIPNDLFQQCPTCFSSSGELTPDVVLALVNICVFDAKFSAERAIPLSGFSKRNERAEFFVDCTLKAADCGGVSACVSERFDAIDCQEDGCRATRKLSVTCNGDVATLNDGTTTATRDCSRAYAQCDPASPTGCTDRHFSACADPALGDRCDGNIRLGCDGAEQVSYRDCAQMGGSCQPVNGRGTCVYPKQDAECADDATDAACSGQSLGVCVNGERVTVDAAAICPAT
ncbi:MAG: hypothetical protein R3B13_32380 [Polyangiaceae bacterium]